jgi:hypothetical protein
LEIRYGHGLSSLRPAPVCERLNVASRDEERSHRVRPGLSHRGTSSGDRSSLRRACVQAKAIARPGGGSVVISAAPMHGYERPTRYCSCTDAGARRDPDCAWADARSSSDAGVTGVGAATASPQLPQPRCLINLLSRVTAMQGDLEGVSESEMVSSRCRVKSRALRR